MNDKGECMVYFVKQNIGLGGRTHKISLEQDSVGEKEIENV
jgi:hypothetical protein